MLPRTVAAALAAATFAVLRASHDVRAQTVPMQYARFCTGEARARAHGKLDSRIARYEAYAAGDPALARQMESSLHLESPPEIVAHHFEALSGVRYPAGDVILVSDGSAAKTKWWTALAASGVVSDVRPADVKSVTRVVGFVRDIASFMLFNDLMGDDASMPRDGCVLAAEAQTADYTGVVRELKTSFETDPPDERDVDRRVAEVWNALPGHAERDAASAAIDRDTFARIGRSPDVRLVYRDPGLPGDGVGPIDIVRIGSATAHTYTTVLERPRGTFDFGNYPLCIVGDTRCAKYYVWP